MKPSTDKATKFAQALTAMESALRILDEAGAPPDVGAHLDLALCRLRASLGCEGEGARVRPWSDHILPN